MAVNRENSRVPGVFWFVLTVALTVAGCVGPVEKMPGSMVTSIDHQVIEETVVIPQGETDGQWWLFVECDYWAQCYTRCDGTKNKCVQLATDAGLKVYGMAPY